MKDIPHLFSWSPFVDHYVPAKIAPPKRVKPPCVPMELIDVVTIAKVRSEYFQGVTIEDIAAANNLNVGEVEQIIDAMNL